MKECSHLLGGCVLDRAFAHEGERFRRWRVRNRQQRGKVANCLHRAYYTEVFYEYAQV